MCMREGAHELFWNLCILAMGLRNVILLHLGTRLAFFTLLMSPPLPSPPLPSPPLPSPPLPSPPLPSPHLPNKLFLREVEGGHCQAVLAGQVDRLVLTAGWDQPAGVDQPEACGEKKQSRVRGV